MSGSLSRLSSFREKKKNGTSKNARESFGRNSSERVNGALPMQTGETVKSRSSVPKKKSVEQAENFTASEKEAKKKAITRRPHGSVSRPVLTIDFLAEQQVVLDTWNSIRHGVDDDLDNVSWMCLGYHSQFACTPQGDESANRNSKSRARLSLRSSSKRQSGSSSRRSSRNGSMSSTPQLVARGDGDISQALDTICELPFRPEWPYWIYLRVDPENITGGNTGRFRSESTASTDMVPHHLQSKFLLISVLLPADFSGVREAPGQHLQRSMVFHEHRPVVEKALSHHLCIQARSRAELEQAVVIDRIVKSFHLVESLVLQVSADDRMLDLPGKSLRRDSTSSTASMHKALMIRMDRSATLMGLKERIAFAFKWDSTQIEVLRVQRQNNASVLRSLVRAESSARLTSSENGLRQAMRQAASKVSTIKLEGDHSILRELDLVNGEELIVRRKPKQSSSSDSETDDEKDQVGSELASTSLVSQRRGRIEDFLQMRARVQEFRRPLYANVRKAASVRNFDPVQDEDTNQDGAAALAAAPHAERKSSSSRRSKKCIPGKSNPLMAGLAQQMRQQQAKLNKVGNPTPPLRRCNSADQLTRFNHSAQLLRELAEDAEDVGARIVDNEDIIILPNKVLGDGRTARVREGLLLCKTDDAEHPALANVKRSQRAAMSVSNRNSWMRMRKKSAVLKPFLEDMESIDEEGQGCDQSSELRKREPEHEPRSDDRSKSAFTRKPSAVSGLPLERPKRDADRLNAERDFFCLKVAVKQFTARYVTEEVFKIFQEEIAVLCQLNCPSIVQVVGVYIDRAPRMENLAANNESSLAILYELMPRGSLSQLREDRDVWLELPKRVKYQMALDVARGVEYLHTRNEPIMHRDLKAANLLIDDDFSLKLGDFGISARASDDHASHEPVGTAGWTAPEVLEDSETEGYGVACDVFSLGVILWEIVTVENNPLGGMAQERYIETLRKGVRPELPQAVQTHEIMYNELVDKCWSFEPSDRPSATQVRETLEAILLASLEDGE